MKLLGIDHIQIAIPAGGEDAGHAFYGAVLGLSEVPKPDALKNRGGVWFEQDHIKLHLGIDPDFQPATKAHPGFLVDDLDSVIEKLTAHDIAITDSEDVASMKRVFASDPFGNRIEFIQR